MVEHRPHPPAPAQVFVHDDPDAHPEDGKTRHYPHQSALQRDRGLCHTNAEPRAQRRQLGQVAVGAKGEPLTVNRQAETRKVAHAARRAVKADERMAFEFVEIRRSPVDTLSGGERQRLGIATLLTQQPLLYFLDEPLAHLDLAHLLRDQGVLCGRRHPHRDVGLAP